MKNKKIIVILAIFSVIFWSLGGTLAYWDWKSDNTLVTFSVDEAFICSADVGGDVNPEGVFLAPAECTSEKNAIKKRLTVYPTVLGDLTVGLDLWLKIKSIAPELSATDHFKYAVTKDENSCTNNVVTEGSFTGKQAGDTIELLKQQVYHESINDGDEYWLYIWLDTAETSLSTANKSFNFILDGTCKDHFEGYTWMINFDANGGNVESSSKAVVDGDTYGILPTPTKDGYTFLGWNTNADGTGENITSDSIVNLDSNTTLYAIWNDAVYVVSYDACDGAGAPSSQTKTYGVTLALSNTIPTRSGYTFEGWATEEIGGCNATNAKYSSGENLTVNKNIVLYAVWKINAYTVNFDPLDGSVSPTSKTVIYGDSYGTLPTPVKTGYDFNGWTNTVFRGEISLTAPASQNYIHTHIIKGIKPGVTYTISIGSATLNSGTATNFSIVIYDYTTSTYITGLNNGVFSSSSQTYTLVSPSTVDGSHDVKLIIYAGISGSTSGNSVTYRNVVVGTMGTTTFSRIQASDIVNYTGNHVLYPDWTLQQYTINYDACGGSGVPSSQTKTYGVTLTLSSAIPTRSGYTFEGWATQDAGGCNATSASYSAGGSYTENVGKMLYAVWETTVNATIDGQDDLTTSTTFSDYVVGSSGSKYVGYNLSKYYVYGLKFTTPSFTGTSKKISFKIQFKDQQSDVDVYLRWALVKNVQNIDSYKNTNNAVIDSNQIASGELFVGKNIGSAADYYIDVDTSQIQSNTTYHLMLWSGKSEYSLVMVRPTDNHSVTVTVVG